MQDLDGFPSRCFQDSLILSLLSQHSYEQCPLSISKVLRVWMLNMVTMNTVLVILLRGVYLLSCYVVSDSLQHRGLEPTRLLYLWNSPGLHFLLQEIFLTQGSNPHLLPWQVDPSPLSPQGSPLLEGSDSLF